MLILRIPKLTLVIRFDKDLVERLKRRLCACILMSSFTNLVESLGEMSVLAAFFDKFNRWKKCAKL